ncbi:MAG: histidine triad nucleotide-binding protein [Chloroflexota bacterium]
MADACLFCKIVSGEIPGTIVFRDEQATAFRDINPAAPTHILIVPNKHIDSVSALTSGDEQLIGHLFSVAGQLAKSEGVDQGGYRLIANTGPDAGQTVFHIHVHLLGGQMMKHPMG